MDVRPFAAALFALTTLSAVAVAAPFVAGDPQPLSALIDASRATVIVRPNEGGPAVWRIDAVLRDATGSVSVGQTVRPKPAPSAGAGRALLISNPDRTVAALPLSAVAADYIASLPAADASAEERLRFACRHLGNEDPLVAEDAFAELARFTAVDLVGHRELLLPDELRTLISDGETPAHRLGLYGYLLGLRGEADDAKLLRRRLFAADGVATGAAGLAAGYLTLAGEDGLADLEAHVLMTPDTSPLLAAAVFEALDFFRTAPAGPFTRERVRRAACCGLVRPDVADLAVGHLAAGRDWEALPDVASLLNAEEADPTIRRASQVSAVRFLLDCRRDADGVPDLRAAAGRLLDEVAANDADLLRRATLLSGAPTERR